MKRIHMLLMALFAVTFMSGCGEKAEKIIPEIKLTDLSASNISIDCNARTVIIGFTSNVSWTASTTADWIVITPSSGNTGATSIRINVQENTSHQSRNTVLTISDKTAEAVVNITVNQEAAPEIPVFSLDQTDFNVKAEGGDIQIKITHNIGYKITSMPDWVHQSSKKTSGDDDKYVFTVDKNNALEAREGVIVFCNDLDVCIPVNIKQAGTSPSLSVTPESVQLTSTGGTEKISVTSNTSWTISKDADWLELGTYEGAGNATILISVSENKSIEARKANIKVSTADGSVSSTVTVQQKGGKEIFSIDKDEINVAAAGESFSVKVTYNIGYKITSLPDWVKQTDKTTNGNSDTYTFKAEANTSSTPREGVIVFCNDNEVCIPITVKQAGAKANGENEDTSTGGKITLD